MWDVIQMVMCLNDARQDPLKYKPLYPCDFNEKIALRLSALTGGARLPLRATGTPVAVLHDRLVWALIWTA